MAKQTKASRREFWVRVLARQRASGLSIQRFCQKEDLASATFFCWKRRISQDSSSSMGAGQPAVGFARIVPDPSSVLASSQIEIVLPGDRRIRLAGRVDKTMLADVLGVLMSAHSIEREG